MRICVAGACGRMGRRILELVAADDDIDIGGAFDVPGLAGTELLLGGESGRSQKVIVSADPAAEVAKSDVLIDFTIAGACVANAQPNWLHWAGASPLYSRPT